MTRETTIKVFLGINDDPELRRRFESKQDYLGFENDTQAETHLIEIVRRKGRGTTIVIEGGLTELCVPTLARKLLIQYPEVRVVVDLEECMSGLEKHLVDDIDKLEKRRSSFMLAFPISYDYPNLHVFPSKPDILRMRESRRTDGRKV